MLSVERFDTALMLHAFLRRDRLRKSRSRTRGSVKRLAGNGNQRQKGSGNISETQRNGECLRSTKGELQMSEFNNRFAAELLYDRVKDHMPNPS